MSVLNSKLERRKTSGGLSDEDLWQAFTAGDDSAYTLLYFRFSDKLYSYLQMLLGSGQDRLLIDDIFQDTFIKIYHERGKFEPRGKGTLASWVFRIAHNFAVTQLRRPHYFSSLDELSEKSPSTRAFHVSPSEPLTDTRSADEVMCMLREIVDTLPTMFKEVYILSEFENMNMDQIGEVLCISRANVKVRLFRARKMVRAQLLRDLDIEEHNGSLDEVEEDN